MPFVRNTREHLHYFLSAIYCNFVSKEEKTALYFRPFLTSFIAFITNFDSAFPGTKRTVKMHILEMHNIEWMSTYKAGFGLMGEKGTNVHFNKLYRTYS